MQCKGNCQRSCSLRITLSLMHCSIPCATLCFASAARRPGYCLHCAFPLKPLTKVYLQTLIRPRFNPLSPSNLPSQISIHESISSAYSLHALLHEPHSLWCAEGAVFIPWYLNPSGEQRSTRTRVAQTVAAPTSPTIALDFSERWICQSIGSRRQGRSSLPLPTICVGRESESCMSDRACRTHSLSRAVSCPASGNTDSEAIPLCDTLFGNMTGAVHLAVMTTFKLAVL